MITDDKYLVLDDVVYSTHYTILMLIAKLLIRHKDGDIIIYENEKQYLDESYRILNSTIEDNDIHIKNKIGSEEMSIFNMMLSRPRQRYTQITDKYLDWLTSKFTNIDDLSVVISPIANMLGAKDIKIIYDDENIIEKLIIKKHDLFSKISQSDIIKLSDFMDVLKNGITEFTNKASRPAIFTANEDVIELFGDEYSILVPKVFRWHNNKKVTAVVENWTFEEVVKESEPNG